MIYKTGRKVLNTVILQYHLGMKDKYVSSDKQSSLFRDG